MKARVKATGEIVELNPTLIDDYDFVDNKGIYYTIEQLELIRESVKPIKKISDPDYWTRLEHIYAGMAIQGILSNPEVDLDYKSDECMPQAVAATAYKIAHALVEKMKEAGR